MAGGRGWEGVWGCVWGVGGGCLRLGVDELAVDGDDEVRRLQARRLVPLVHLVDDDLAVAEVRQGEAELRVGRRPRQHRLLGVRLPLLWPSDAERHDVVSGGEQVARLVCRRLPGVPAHALRRRRRRRRR